MKHTTIILGPPESGKSTLMREFVKHRKHLYVPGYFAKSPFGFSNVDNDTEVLILDEIGSLSEIRYLMSQEKIWINKQCRIPFEVERPELIIISDKFKNEDFPYRPNQTIINCPINIVHMPIDYSKYPENWLSEIRPRILNRADNRCEFCGVMNYTIHPSTGSIVILTIAHLDREIKNNDDFNLAALCQRCHLNHDRSTHIMNRKYGRNYKDNQLNINL